MELNGVIVKEVRSEVVPCTYKDEQIDSKITIYTGEGYYYATVDYDCRNTMAVAFREIGNKSFTTDAHISDEKAYNAALDIIMTCSNQ